MTPDPRARGDAYDLVPYTAHAYAEAHPDRLAVVARLSGWAAPEVTRARILELGCGRGGHLLPMARSLPDATLVGVDRAARQIEEAHAIAAATGLGNVTWHAASFEDAPLDDGFDYVVCHGMASWVPPATRRALLRRIAHVLAPGGVAYVSFNVLPGWYERLAARDWLRFAGGTDAPAPALAWLAERVPPERAEYKHLLDTVARRLAHTDAAYATHEYLADAHHPELVGRVLAEAADAGLAYLGDAIPQSTALELADPAVVARADGLAVHDAQQLLDFVAGTAFRRALFVRADTAASRAWRWPRRLDVGALASLRLASRLVPEGDATGDAGEAGIERFTAADLTVEVAHAGTRRALRALADAAPAALGWQDLVARAGADEGLAEELFEVWLATAALDLHAFAPALATAVSARPRACPVARWHAMHGGPLTNAWHQEVVLPEPLVRAVLALADGTRTPDEMARAMSRSGGAASEARELVEKSLAMLASLGVLVA